MSFISNTSVIKLRQERVDSDWMNMFLFIAYLTDYYCDSVGTK